MGEKKGLNKKACWLDYGKSNCLLCEAPGHKSTFINQSHTTKSTNAPWQMLGDCGEGTPLPSKQTSLWRGGIRNTNWHCLLIQIYHIPLCCDIIRASESLPECCCANADWALDYGLKAVCSLISLAALKPLTRKLLCQEFSRAKKKGKKRGPRGH